MSKAANRHNDPFAQRSAWLLWGLPFAVLAITAVVDVGPLARTGLWTLSLLAAGIACVVNARRSGRLHCHITGPFVLVLAALSFVHGAGIVVKIDRRTRTKHHEYRRPEVYARGAVVHPDHRRLWLEDWRRVVRNREIGGTSDGLRTPWID